MQKENSNSLHWNNIYRYYSAISKTSFEKKKKKKKDSSDAITTTQQSQQVISYDRRVAQNEVTRWHLRWLISHQFQKEEYKFKKKIRTH